MIWVRYTPFSDTHMLVMFDCHPSARLENHGVGNHQPNENDSIPPEPKVDSRAWGKIAADGTGLRRATCRGIPRQKCIVDCEWVWVKSFGMSIGPIPLESLRFTKQMVLTPSNLECPWDIQPITQQFSSLQLLRPSDLLADAWLFLVVLGPFFNECT